MGDVALHTDEDQHMAVILSVDGDDCEALFFTSNPFWSNSFIRRATRDELAMAGYVQSKPTYITYVRRYASDFQPLGRTFPMHRVEALLAEFRPVQKMVQREGG